jgi:lipid A 4'-phosphatase
MNRKWITPKMEKTRPWLKRHVAVVLFLGMVLLFLLFPNMDLLVSSWFYRADTGFYLNDTTWVQSSYKLFATLHNYLFFTLLWLLFASWKWRRASEQGLRKRLWFLLLVLMLGPGLMVSVLKDNSGRARPSTIIEFGGEKDYTAVLRPASQCELNCSFVSGHAAMGFFFISLAWVFRDRRWLWSGIILGSLVGLGRIVQGAHFFSDIVFSFWVVYASCALIARYLLDKRAIRKPL